MSHIFKLGSVYYKKIKFFFLQAEDGIRDLTVTGVQTCALPIYASFIADGATWAYGLPDSGLYVSTSTDYGNTWSSPVTVSYDGPPTWTPPNPPPPPDPNYRYNDRDQITVDTFVSNNVYVSWIKDRG